jgi:hypothetical protein
LIDEPIKEMYPSVTTFTKWVHEFAPGLPNMITKQPDPMMQGVDIWCPLTPSLDLPELETHLEQGGTLWTYVCSGPGRPHANFFLHQPGMTNRIPLWLAYKYGAEGFLYWEHAWWYGRDPWTDQSFQGMPDTWGDGLLVYPGPDGPINSIRFEIVREGIQDVEYFLFLEDLVSKLPQDSPKRKQAEQLLIIGDDLIRSPKDWNPDAKAFLNRKAEVARQIELLLQD